MTLGCLIAPGWSFSHLVNAKLAIPNQMWWRGGPPEYTQAPTSLLVKRNSPRKMIFCSVFALFCSETIAIPKGRGYGVIFSGKLGILAASTIIHFWATPCFQSARHVSNTQGVLERRHWDLVCWLLVCS